MPEVKARRLCRYTVPIDAQENYESEKSAFFKFCCQSRMQYNSFFFYVIAFLQIDLVHNLVASSGCLLHTCCHSRFFNCN